MFKKIRLNQDLSPNIINFVLKRVFGISLQLHNALCCIFLSFPKGFIWKYHAFLCVLWSTTRSTAQILASLLGWGPLLLDHPSRTVVLHHLYCVLNLSACLGSLVSKIYSESGLSSDTEILFRWLQLKACALDACPIQFSLKIIQAILAFSVSPQGRAPKRPRLPFLMVPAHLQHHCPCLTQALHMKRTKTCLAVINADNAFTTRCYSGLLALRESQMLCRDLPWQESSVAVPEQDYDRFLVSPIFVCSCLARPLLS